MNLKKKKALAAKTFGVGKGRISFAPSRADELKEAITKQDMRDLLASGAITIKNIKGSRKNIPNMSRRGAGKIKKKVGTRKRDYMRLTRKLRRYLVQLKYQNKVSKEKYKEARKQIKSKNFRSKLHFREMIIGGGK